MISAPNSVFLKKISNRLTTWPQGTVVLPEPRPQWHWFKDNNKPTDSILKWRVFGGVVTIKFLANVALSPSGPIIAYKQHSPCLGYGTAKLNKTITSNLNKGHETRDSLSIFWSHTLLLYLQSFRRNSPLKGASQLKIAKKSLKPTNAPYFEGSVSFKVIMVDNPK